MDLRTTDDACRCYSSSIKTVISPNDYLETKTPKYDVKYDLNTMTLAAPRENTAAGNCGRIITLSALKRVLLFDIFAS